MKHIVSGDLPTVREWIKSMREKTIARVIDAAEKRSPDTLVPTLEMAIIDPRKINQFIDGEGAKSK